MRRPTAPKSAEPRRGLLRAVQPLGRDGSWQANATGGVMRGKLAEPTQYAEFWCGTASMIQQGTASALSGLEATQYWLQVLHAGGASPGTERRKEDGIYAGHSFLICKQAIECCQPAQLQVSRSQLLYTSWLDGPV